MGLAVFVYIVYVNFLGAVLAWVEQDLLVIEYAFWFVHLVFLCIAFLLMWLRNKGIKQLMVAL